MRRIHWTLPAAALCLVGALLSGCALLQTPSPTSTVTDASGHETTLSWADYPADPFTEPADVLAAPRAEHVDAMGRALLADLQAAIDREMPALAWQHGTEGGVHPHDGNGYGGATLHQTYNSAGIWVDEAPEDWRAMIAVIEAELAEHGYGPIAWDFDRELYPHETPAERDADVAQMHGSLEPDEMWWWMGNARHGTMWVSVGLHDIRRGAGAPPDTERPDQQLSLWVGGTVIASSDEQAYREGIARFAGLERPSESHPS